MIHFYLSATPASRSDAYGREEGIEDSMRTHDTAPLPNEWVRSDRVLVFSASKVELLPRSGGQVEEGSPLLMAALART